MWNQCDENILIESYQSGKDVSQIAIELDKTEISIYKKLKRLNLFQGRNKFWNNDDLILLKSLINDGLSINDISEKMERTIDSIRKKAKRNNLVIPKYIKEPEWENIQKDYDYGLTYKDILHKYKLTPQKIISAQNLGYLKLRNLKDAYKKGIEMGRIKVKDKNLKIYEEYRKMCSFNFNLADFPEEFSFDIVEKFGWYRAKNNGDNIDGVSRDHMVSIKYGFENSIDPKIISHPANCRLILQKENSSKNSKNSISLDELKEKIIFWDLKYGKLK